MVNNYDSFLLFLCELILIKHSFDSKLSNFILILLKTHILNLKYTRTYFIISLFVLPTITYAQDSESIVKLRQQLKNAKDEKTLSNAKVALLKQFSKEGNSDSAISYSLELIDYAKKIKDYTNVGNFYMTVYTNYLIRGEREKAEKYRLEAQKYLKMSDDANAKAMLLVNNAQNLSVQNKLEEASKVLDEVFVLVQDPKNKLSVKLISNSYLMSIGNFQQRNKSSDAYKRGLEFLDYCNKYNKESLDIAYYMLGMVQYKLKNSKKALEFLNKSEELMVNKNSAFLSEINVMRSFCYLDLKEFDKAKKFATFSLEYAENQKLTNSLPRLYYLFSNIFQKEKNYTKALEYAQKAIEESPEKDLYQLKANAKLLLHTIKVDQIEDRTVVFDNAAEKKAKLQNLRAEIEVNYKSLLKEELVHNDDVDRLAFEYFSKVDEMLGNHESAFFYYKKYKKIENNASSSENIRAVEETQTERSLAEQRLRIKFEEETKHLQLQKELELKSLKFEFDKKQAAAKTEEERKRLMLEEEHKRREISIKYDEEQKSVALKYEQEKKIAKSEQAKKDAESKAELSKSKNIRNMSIGGAATALLLLGFAGWSYNQKRKDRNKIAFEKKKSEDLLLNILPYEVAQELKEKGKSDAKYYDEVSVLFTDFVNFTATSERIGVQELLEELNVCFTEFDNIMGKHGLEKIKTIGDAYLAVSGLPTENKDHAKNAINASQDILKFIDERKKVSPHALDLRIGIHSGHVIAGIVGVKKFAYDIWGDTVNTAARMEQNSEKGKINISKNTYDLVKDNFNTTYRGKLSVKGKGEMDMYFVEPTA